jgi:hypothetical protein
VPTATDRLEAIQHAVSNPALRKVLSSSLARNAFCDLAAEFAAGNQELLLALTTKEVTP